MGSFDWATFGQSRVFINIRRPCGHVERGGGTCPHQVLAVTLPLTLFQPGGGYCVLKWGFMRTFPGNQDAMKCLSFLLLVFEVPY